jgi:ribonuclease-3
MQSGRENMKDTEKVIGYKFTNKDLLKQALTHSSAGNDLSCGSRLKFDNERLEFLGDSILSLAVSRHLYDNLTDKSEGVLTKIRAGLVCEEALYGYAKKIDLGERLIMGKGEIVTGGRDRKSILSDAFEALIAAMYLDAEKSGNDGFNVVQKFIVPFIPDVNSLRNIKTLKNDYKSAFQEIVQRDPDAVITYEIIGERGEAHAKVFFAKVFVNGKVRGEGSGKTKKEAQQNAAKCAMKS